MASTRSAVRRDHAVLAPESHVAAPLPGWTGSSGIVLIGPAMGARFSWILVTMGAGAEAAPPLPGVERLLYVLEGELQVGVDHLVPGGYAFVPAEQPHGVTARRPSRALVLERPYLPRAGTARPHFLAGREDDVHPAALLGDEDIQVRALLPDAPQFDLAVNTMAYAPGAALSQVEVHVMEHGLLMLEGRMVYRLADAWYQVEAGDAIWMGPFCPQWCCAYGREPARYLIYKDWNRDPLA